MSLINFGVGDYESKQKIFPILHMCNAKTAPGRIAPLFMPSVASKSMFCEEDVFVSNHLTPFPVFFPVVLCFVFVCVSPLSDALMSVLGDLQALSAAVMHSSEGSEEEEEREREREGEKEREEGQGDRTTPASHR